jgi:hypothetical protein
VSVVQDAAAQRVRIDNGAYTNVIEFKRGLPRFFRRYM